jgi:hypothetical protein
VTETERLELQVKSASDQVRAALRESGSEILSISRRDPSTWSEDDYLVTRLVMSAVAGMLLAGEI